MRDDEVTLDIFFLICVKCFLYIYTFQSFKKSGELKLAVRNWQCFCWCTCAQLWQWEQSSVWYEGFVGPPTVYKIIISLTDCS